MSLSNPLPSHRRSGSWLRRQISALFFQPRIWYLLLIFVLFYSTLILRYAERFDFNLTGFITIGDDFVPDNLMTEDTIVFEDSMGYDGQFYFIMVHDPLLRNRFYRYLDIPAYRYQRIVYPWMVYIFSLGNPILFPLMLILVNLAAIGMGMVFIALMLRNQRMNIWYALFYGLLSGLFIATVRDLSGPLSVGFMVGGLYFYYRKQFLLCALFLSAAILTREIILAVLPILIIDTLFFKKDLNKIIYCILPLAPFLLWQFHVFERTQATTWQSGRLGIPLLGIINGIKKAFMNPTWYCPENVYFVLFIVVTALTFILAIQEILGDRNEITLGFLMFSAMPLFMTEIIWTEPWGYSRIFLPSAVFLLLSFIRSKRKAYLLPLSIHVLLFVVALKWLYVI